jgi:hypothetical protein
MAVDHFGRIGRWALWSPVVIVPALLALMPWVENDLIAFALAIFVTGYSIFVAERFNRRYDEVQIAGQRFAQTKGMTFGAFAALLVMAFPPSMNALVALANTLANTLHEGSRDKAVHIGIGFGYVLLILSQFLGMFASAIWWERRLGSLQSHQE